MFNRITHKIEHTREKKKPQYPHPEKKLRLKGKRQRVTMNKLRKLARNQEVQNG